MFDFIEKIDIKILKYISDNLNNRFLNKIMPKITALGDLGLIWIVIGFLFISNIDYREIGKLIFLALILTTIVGEGVIKHIVRRKRPFIKREGQNLLITEPITHSFPSGHTASSFAVAAVFIRNESGISLLICLIAILIGYSRIYLKVHYPSDVLGGAIIGYFCGYWVTTILS
ncbi:phosphatase PAP2 family protein [Clostridium paraputrificum]|uniref:phosphatase PAP2 family protein n=1 Tax=Clostridium paraputrificum TaxID=29363 RepID=UPI003D331F4E